jgi:hypothetical protein
MVLFHVRPRAVVILPEVVGLLSLHVVDHLLRRGLTHSIGGDIVPFGVVPGRGVMVKEHLDRGTGESTANLLFQ